MVFRDEIAFKVWCQSCGYDEQTIQVIQRIRRSPPIRNVTGGRGNVHARVPSHKMGVTIQSESRTVEKPGMRIFYEYDDFLEEGKDASVIEYYDQPEKIKLKYMSGSGNKVSVWHTADFFVIRETGAGWEEWKSESELEKLSEKQANRYRRNEQGQWCCPPGEAYAQQFGLSYRLRSNAEIDWNLYSNLEFLHEYLVVGRYLVSSTVEEWLKNEVRQAEGISLSRLLQIGVASADEVYSQIARQQLYVDLYRNRLTETDRVQVFTSKVMAEADHNLQQYNQSMVDKGMYQLQPGCQLIWDGQLWELVNPGIDNIHLRHVDHHHCLAAPNRQPDP